MRYSKQAALEQIYNDKDRCSLECARPRQPDHERARCRLRRAELGDIQRDAPRCRARRAHGGHHRTRARAPLRSGGVRLELLGFDPLSYGAKFPQCLAGLFLGQNGARCPASFNILGIIDCSATFSSTPPQELSVRALVSGTIADLLNRGRNPAIDPSPFPSPMSFT